ncbi:MAG: hypothetical protein KME17_29450 [Cyanosarcina radialis HA8281-LM2]|jgi:hypothetical protein|nr:hypothetical protein [Cyanosarcina radialis HA8281-LM2]
MNRQKIVAIATGAISLLLAIVYLMFVQLLDFRGEMLPAPQSLLPPSIQIASLDSLPMPTNLPRDMAGRS